MNVLLTTGTSGPQLPGSSLPYKSEYKPQLTQDWYHAHSAAAGHPGVQFPAHHPPHGHTHPGLFSLPTPPSSGLSPHFQPPH